MPYANTPPDKLSDPRSLLAYATAYVEQLRTSNYATKSVDHKFMSLQCFIIWCEERGIHRIEQITRPVLQRYQRYLYYAVSGRGKPLSVQTQRNRLMAVRTWFRFLIRENLILMNPASELELPKAEKRLPKHFLTSEEAEQVLSQPDLGDGLGLRDRAILEVLYSTGIRRQELVDLQRQDLNHGAGILAVRQGKGKKDRFVPIGERALQWVDRYQREVRYQYALPSSPDNLFLTHRGQRLDNHYLGRTVKRYVKMANIDKVGSCHLFRHTMATLMLENGADIRFIQHILGHNQLSTTEIYTHVVIHKLKEVHTLTHPAKVQQRSVESLSEEPQHDDPEAELLAALAVESEEDESA